MSNGKVAGAVLGVAAVLGGGWCKWGMEMHKVRMEHANAYERKLAKELGWENKLELTAFKPCNLAPDGDDEAVHERQKNAKWYLVYFPWTNK